MQQIIATDDLRLDVGEESEGATLFSPMFPGDFPGINADRHHSDLTGPNPLPVALETPQLGVAEGSPVAPVADQFELCL